MKLILLVVLLFGAVPYLEADLRLAGIVKTQSGYLFAVCDSAKPEGGRWLHIGQAFDGYQLKSFDEGPGILQVTADTKTILVSMAKRDATGESAVDISRISDAELRNLGLYRVQPGDTGLKIGLKTGVSLATLSMLNPDTEFFRLKVGQILVVSENPPNQALEPTGISVTPSAGAEVAPAIPVAHH